MRAGGQLLRTAFAFAFSLAACGPQKFEDESPAAAVATGIPLAAPGATGVSFDARPTTPAPPVTQRITPAPTAIPPDPFGIEPPEQDPFAFPGDAGAPPAKNAPNKKKGMQL